MGDVALTDVGPRSAGFHEVGAEMKYRILRDYGAYEGMKLDDGVFNTVDAAVKKAVSDSCGGIPFKIVVEIEWQAVDPRGGEG